MSVSNGNLTYKQSAAIRALLSNSSIESAAQEAGVNPRTVYRWLKQPVFVAALRKAEGEMIGDAVRLLIIDMRRNLDVMRAVRDDLSIPPSVRLRAAALLDSSLLRWREIQDVEQRLSNLEVAVYGEANR